MGNFILSPCRLTLVSARCDVKNLWCKICGAIMVSYVKGNLPLESGWIPGGPRKRIVFRHDDMMSYFLLLGSPNRLKIDVQLLYFITMVKLGSGTVTKIAHFFMPVWKVFWKLFIGKAHMKGSIENDRNKALISYEMMKITWLDSEVTVCINTVGSINFDGEFACKNASWLEL